MTTPARFGPPVAAFQRGGAHVAVHLVPVFDGRLVAFDVGPPAPGRWLPWDLLPFAGNPYESAAALGDEWCDGAVIDLRLCDALSLAAPGESWELALIFRAELDAMPAGDDARAPVALGAGPALASVTRFAAADLERWLAETSAALSPPAGTRLVF
jgi:hypothetical protein